MTHLVLEGSWRFGRRRCRYALIRTRLSLPKCRVSYWASINCLLRSRLPWCSAAFQSNESSTSSFSTTQLLFIRLKKPCAFCINQLLCPPTLLPRTNCSESCAHHCPSICGTARPGRRFGADWMSFGGSLYKLTPLAEGLVLENEGL